MSNFGKIVVASLLAILGLAAVIGKAGTAAAAPPDPCFYCQ